MNDAGFVSADRHESEVDLRTYLINPPPTAEQEMQVARRRLLVKRSSLALVGLIAVVLLAPWPAGKTQDERRQVATTGSKTNALANSESMSAQARPPDHQETLPRRIDTAEKPPNAREASTPRKRAQNPTHPSKRAITRVPSAQESSAGAPPKASLSSSSSQSTPPVPDEGALVPIM